MASISLQRLKAYRAQSFHFPPAPRIATPEAALDFVNERGFVYFWPIKGITLPSLWTAVAGDRPVADAHDDPGHVTWGWKDEALGKRIWYYAKILRRKATIISLDVAPYFYALSENYGSPEEDYLLAYEEGRLTQGAKQIYEALLKEGALNTVDLRRVARLGNAKESEFNRALEDLQADFKILPIGIAEAGAWKYSFIYEVTPRYYPELPDKARKIGESEARVKLTELYFQAVGAAQARDVSKLFRWSNELMERALRKLIERGLLVQDVTYPKQPGEWLALPELIK
jgi:winged helix DNA-binding protein